MGAFTNVCVSSINRTPFCDTSACQFLLANVGYAVFNLSKTALDSKMPWAWEYAESIKKRRKSHHQVMGPETETWLHDGFSTRLGPELGYKIGRG